MITIKRYGAPEDELKRIQGYAKSFAKTLRFEHCYLIHNSDKYTYCYKVDVDQQNEINKVEAKR